MGEKNLTIQPRTVEVRLAWAKFNPKIISEHPNFNLISESVCQMPVT